MSRLPLLSTPGRTNIPGPSTGIPTPTNRRTRSSLGPSSQSISSTSDEVMDQALQEVLKTRPPSSMKSSIRVQLEGDGDPDTPTHPPFLKPDTGLGLGPRTPGLRPRTPATPSNRAVSRASTSSRPSIASTQPFTPRRTSMASSTTSTTPYGKRPESRASVVNSAKDAWMPVVGERVRLSGQGMEGTLRFLGETQFKGGVWAGIELSGGFAGRGKNNGIVDGVEYFACPPECGMFILATRLSPPSTLPSRPASVASSHRSLASSQASYSLNGRATPSADSHSSRPTTTTPHRATARSVSTYKPIPSLAASTSSNSLIDGKITAGSRASKYLGMTAKQLDSARNGTLSASVKGLNQSTMTMNSSTPKASRISMGVGGNGLTPARGARQSLGGFATPKARLPRGSEMMPPPPSPGNIGRAVQAHQNQLEEEIRELKRRNAELEDQLRGLPTEGDLRGEKQRLEALQAEIDRLREESDSLRYQLSSSQADAADASKLAEELQERERETGGVEGKEKELAGLRKEMRLLEERARGELEAGMEAKRVEVEKMQEKVDAMQVEMEQYANLTEQLTQAGQDTISLYEHKQFDFEDTMRSLEEKNRSLEEKLRQAREESSKSALESSPRGTTAAEIDNETLKSQLAHYQTKLSHLEEELDEAKVAGESDMELMRTKLAKSRDGERGTNEVLAGVKGEVKRLEGQLQGAKGRVGELEGALKENQVALEGARAEIEGLRGEAAEASSMRAALATAASNEKALAEKQVELKKIKDELETATATASRGPELEAKISALETEVTSLKQSLAKANLPKQNSPFAPSRRTRLSTGSTAEDEEKRLRGFQHIITELSAENAEIKEQYESVLEEVGLLKEEIKLLEESQGMEGGAGSAKEWIETKATVSAHAQTIKELNREVSELESLIESKIYREDELETQLQELRHQLDHLAKSRLLHAATTDSPVSPTRSSQHSRTNSSTTAEGGEDRCELCEGPHDLDACPVFAGNTLGGGEEDLGGKGKRCADCDSRDHATAECPLAEDVF